MNNPNNPLAELAKIREEKKKVKAAKDAKDLKAFRKDRKDALLFAANIYQIIGRLDEAMAHPKEERGRIIAKAINDLEMCADCFTHFTLDQSFPSIAKLKGKKP